MISLLEQLLAYGLVALVISTTSRAFGTLNLAAGSWVTTGSWLMVAILGSFAGATGNLVRAVAFVPIAFAAVAQAGLAWAFGRNIIEKPMGFLLLTLGCHRIVDAITVRWLLTSSQDRIPETFLSPEVSIVGLLACLGAALLLKNARWFCRLSFEARLADNASRVWPRVAGVLALEILLFLGIGGAAAPALRGIQGDEFLTIVPILAVCATRSDAVGSFLLAVAARGAILLTQAFLPEWGIAGSYVVILFLGAAAGFQAWPARFLTGARRTERLVPGYSSLGSADAIRGRLTSIMSHPASVLSMLGVAIVLVAVMTPPLGHAMSRGLWVLALAGCAATASQYLGVRTVAWPLVATMGAFLLSRSGGMLGAIAALLTLSAIWSIYLLSLRAMAAGSALVVDLAATVGFIGLANSTGLFGGYEGVRDIALGNGPWSVVASAIVLSAVVLLAMTAGPILMRQRAGRGAVMGLTNLSAGSLHGYSSVAHFAFSAMALGIAASIAGAATAAERLVLTERDASVGFGLLVLLLASFIESVPLLVAAIVVVLIPAVIEKPMAGSGALLDLVVGLLLIVLAVASNQRLEERT